MKYILAPFLAILFFSGCSIKYKTQKIQTLNEKNRNTINELSLAITKLSTTIDTTEAKKVATIATLYPLELANEYQLVSPPLFHNTLINMNLKKRGFCYHFAQDISQELKKLKLKTIELRWATHKKQNYWEHNAIVLTAKQQSFKKGVLLDAWRNSGVLYWDYVQNDTAYNWNEDLRKSRYYGTTKQRGKNN